MPLLLVGAPWGCGSGTDTVVLPDGEKLTLSIEPAKSTKEVGQTQPYKGITTDTDGTITDVTTLVRWSSSDPSIATIDAKTGSARGISPGSVVITTMRNNVVATATLKVIAAAEPDGTAGVGGMSDGSGGMPMLPIGAGGAAGAADGSGGAAGMPAASAGAAGMPDAGAPGTGGPVTRIYVSNLGEGSTLPSIRVFERAAVDNATPVAIIEGATTTLKGPSQMAVAGNELFVANGEGKSILVFDLNKQGNIAPLRTISGNNTTFSNFSPMGLALHGSSIVATDQSKGLFVFPASGSGDIAPTRIGPDFFYAAHVSNSPVANEILLAVPTPSSEVRGYLETATATDAPLRVLKPGRAWARGVTSSPDGIFVVTCGQGGASIDDAISVFAPTAKTNDAPIRAIVGLNTGLADPHGISVYGGEIYVSNQSESAVRVFPLTADGDVAPSRVIKGPQTGLSFPSGMLVATTGG
ncbi:MAG TPA: Ig-like domain-containing protein [Polyangiaceae bacterium]|nr:Ig-like domain-containing protein [Polyangiaceae bacterium]